MSSRSDYSYGSHHHGSHHRHHHSHHHRRDYERYNVYNTYVNVNYFDSYPYTRSSALLTDYPRASPYLAGYPVSGSYLYNYLLTSSGNGNGECCKYR